MTLDVTLHLVDSIDEVMALKTWMSERRPFIAVDTETEGLQWWKDQPRMLQVGDSYTAWAIPWHLWGGAILEILRDFQGDLVMHNMPFDIMMFERWSGVQLPRHRIHDTRIQSHLLEPHKSTGLKAVAERHVDRRAAQSQRILNEAMKLHNWTWATVPIDFQPYWVYAAMDCILTSRVHEHHYPLVQQQCPLAYELEMAEGHVLIDVMWTGVAVDRDYTTQRLSEFERYVEQASRWTKDEYGVEAGSDVKVIERLQRDIPSSVYEFTKLTKKTKRPSLDREVLEEVIKTTHHPLAEVVLQRRRIQGICSKYLRKFLELEVNGRIHPSFNPVKRTDDDTNEYSGYGAKTGRMSVSDPPLQQLPRKDNDNPVANVVRKCITASSGNLMVMCDFDQIEFRIYAHLCQDPGLIQAFEREGDFFLNMTREIFSDPTIIKADPRRQTTKNAGYAKIYGAGIPKFALTAGIEVDAAATFMNQLDTLYPAMNTFNQQVDQIARQREQTEGVAYVQSQMTRRRFINDDGRYYALVNYLIQGMAAEVLKMKNVELKAAGLSHLLVLDVHDEMILDCPQEDSPEVAHTLKDIMEDSDLFRVKLTASLDSGPTWGSGNK